jgi:hypothetical protein
LRFHCIYVPRTCIFCRFTSPFLSPINSRTISIAFVLQNTCHFHINFPSFIFFLWLVNSDALVAILHPISFHCVHYFESATRTAVVWICMFDKVW